MTKWLHMWTNSIHEVSTFVTVHNEAKVSFEVLEIQAVFHLKLARSCGGGMCYSLVCLR